MGKSPRAIRLLSRLNHSGPRIAFGFIGHNDKSQSWLEYAAIGVKTPQSRRKYAVCVKNSASIGHDSLGGVSL